LQILKNPNNQLYVSSPSKGRPKVQFRNGGAVLQSY
jgi:hypothetical protein